MARLTFYDIENEILKCIDEETGEIINEQMLNDLLKTKDAKIEGLACYVLDLQAQAKAINEHIEELKMRSEKKQKKAEKLTEYLAKVLDYQKFETAKVVISYTHSTKVQVADVDLLPEEYIRTKTTVTREPDKKAIKEVLSKGGTILGAELIESTNTKIK